MKTATRRPRSPDCRLRVVNELAGTTFETILPVSPKQAERTCHAVEQALQFSRVLDHNDPLAVVVTRTWDSIVIRWHVEGDIDAARQLFDRWAAFARGDDMEGGAI